MSRLELSTRAGVSLAAITDVTQTLLRDGLLLEETISTSVGRRRGRPTQLLTLAPDHSYFVGVSIGEENTDIALTNLRGEVLASESLDERILAENLSTIVRSGFLRLLRKTQVERERLRGAGIAVAGIVDQEAGVCRYSAALGWQDVPVAEKISSGLRMSAWAENDANAVALGEKIFGLAREYDNFSSIILDRTVGSAHYMNGMLYRGHNGSAGEIGHITISANNLRCRCGREGCLDTVAGSYAVLRAAKEAGLEVHSVRNVEDLAARGNAIAATLLRKAGAALGSTVATLVQLSNPQAVLFTDFAGFGNGIFRTATRQAIENGILPRFLGTTEIVFDDTDQVVPLRSAASIAAFNYLMSL